VSDSDIGGDLPPLDPELSAWLAADTPGPMPEEVWSGIEARLAAEAPLVPAGVVDLQAERRRRRPGRVLPVLAGAAGLVLVGAVVVPSLQTSSPSPVADGASSAAPMVAAEGPASADPGSVVVAPAPTQTEATQTEPTQTDSSPAMPRAMVSSGTDYTADALPTQVTTLLASAGMADSAAVASALTATPTETPAPGVGLASSPEALADCLGRLGLPPESVPLVLDTATIDGVEGSVIVTVGAQGADGRPTSLHVVAVGQDCNDGDVAAARHWDLPLR
jgi:hypothetical protein